MPDKGAHGIHAIGKAGQELQEVQRCPAVQSLLYRGDCLHSVLISRLLFSKSDGEILSVCFQEMDRFGGLCFWDQDFRLCGGRDRIFGLPAGKRADPDGNIRLRQSQKCRGQADQSIGPPEVDPHAGMTTLQPFQCHLQRIVICGGRLAGGLAGESDKIAACGGIAEEPSHSQSRLIR